MLCAVDEEANPEDGKGNWLGGSRPGSSFSVNWAQATPRLSECVVSSSAEIPGILADVEPHPV